MQRLIKNVPNQLLSKSLRRHRHFRNWSTSTSSANSSGDSKNEEDKNVSIYSALMEFPKEADVVIIGGGSLGCQTQYHLAKLGITNTVLLEKDRLTAGTTWHTAGLVWSLRPNDTDTILINELIAQVKRLEDETGVNPGWINNGGLFIANNKERLDEYKRLHTFGKAFGIESHVLSPEETKKLYPLMNVSDIYGTLYSPADGTIDPNGICQATTRYAKQKGAKVYEHVSVRNILTEPTSNGSTKVTEVITSNGPIKTQAVVNCTGAWANYITGMVGLKIPLIGMHHAYVTTDRIEGIEGMPNVRDHDASVYLKLQGDALHIGGYEPNPILIEKGIQKEFAFGLFELDWEVFGVHIEGAVNRVPCVEQTGIKSTVCGPESFTPDHKPIMGEDPRVRGFYHGCGFNSSGMMLGAGCGNQLAHWIVDGRPTLDMSGYDIRRYCPEISTNDSWIAQRSHESYAKNYAMIFTHDEPLAGRNAKKDPLYDELLSAGCIYQERLGWERPGWFSDTAAPALDYDWYGAYGHTNRSPGQDIYKKLLNMDYTYDYPEHHQQIRNECLATRNSAALFNMSYFGKFLLSGPDADQAVEWIFTNKVASNDPGKTVYTCMLNKNAGIEADLTVSVLRGQDENSKEYYVAAAGGAAYHNYAHILAAIQDKKLNCQLEDVSRQFGMISLQGPRSRQILQKLTTDCDLSNEAFPFSTNKYLNIAGHKVLALRVSFVGELGWELHIANESLVAVYRAVMEAGREFGVVNAGYRAIDALSIEKGYPHWHQEIKMDDTPLEAGLMFTCKLKTDTDFQGRTALVRQKENGGPTKKKVCFTLDDNKSVCMHGLESIYKDGEVVGYVRRADYAFHMDYPICYGYVHHPQGEKVTNKWLSEGSYQIEVLGQLYPANLHLKSPFDSKNLRIQGHYDEEALLCSAQNVQ